jgi:hypothetical protein
MGTGSGVSNGISTSATSGFEIYMEGNNISGVLHPVDTTSPVTLYSKGMNFVGNTVFNGANTLISPAIDNLVVNENIIYNTSGDLVSSPATTYSPVSSQRMKQCQFTGSSLTVNPPSGYQPGQLFVLEIFNASGSAATVTMNSGTVPAAYKGSLTSGVSLNNAQRVIVQMVYITNTWLELSKAVI